MVQTALSFRPASPDEAVAVHVSVTDTCVTSSLEHKDVATRHWYPRTVVSFAQMLELVLSGDFRVMKPVLKMELRRNHVTLPTGFFFLFLL